MSAELPLRVRPKSFHLERGSAGDGSFQRSALTCTGVSQTIKDLLELALHWPYCSQADGAGGSVSAAMHAVSMRRI